MNVTALLITLGIYVVGIPVAHFIICYTEAVPDGKGGYKVDTSGIIPAALSWPLLLIMVIFVAPFRFSKKLALKLKKARNPKKINMNPYE
jgi:hypothetical protein